jgi:branched-subunit amino acid transport protein
MSDIALVVFGSALATYLPRFLPFFMPWIARLKGRAAMFLEILPVAALGALIFPGVLEAFPGQVYAGLCGVAAAFVAAWFIRGLILPVLLSIAAVLALQVLM